MASKVKSTKTFQLNAVEVKLVESYRKMENARKAYEMHVEAADEFSDLVYDLRNNEFDDID